MLYESSVPSLTRRDQAEGGVPAFFREAVKP